MPTQSGIPGKLSPEEAKRFQADMEDMQWFDEHAKEIYASCRGKYVMVANKELFVGDTPEEVLAKVRAKYPDRGAGIHYIHPNPPRRMIYDCAGGVRSDS